MAAETVRRFGIEPRVALLSHSNFGSSLMLYTRILNWACTAPHASKRTADNRIRFITLIVLECLSAANVADGKPPGRVKLLLKYYGGVIPGYPNPFLYLL